MNYTFLLPFVPSKDFEISKSFNLALGFEIGYQTDCLVEFHQDNARFYLQKFYNEVLANNYMLQLNVSSIDEFYEFLKSKDEIKTNYKPPQEMPWGRVIHLIGPSGELWHITELTKSI